MFYKYTIDGLCLSPPPKQKYQSGRGRAEIWSLPSLNFYRAPSSVHYNSQMGMSTEPAYSAYRLHKIHPAAGETLCHPQTQIQPGLLDNAEFPTHFAFHSAHQKYLNS